MSNIKRIKDMKIEDEINRYKGGLAKMISDSDFTKYFTDAKEKTMKYSELSNYNTIDELLSKPKDYRIILTESKLNEGHWCCLTKNNNRYVWFDSYGVRPDGELALIPLIIKKMLKEDKHYLSRLIKTIPKGSKFEYNKKAFQKLKDGINTCGRWVLAYLILFHINYTLKEFQDFFKDNKEVSGKPYDLLVVDWITD